MTARRLHIKRPSRRCALKPLLRPRSSCAASNSTGDDFIGGSEIERLGELTDVAVAVGAVAMPDGCESLSELEMLMLVSFWLVSVSSVLWCIVTSSWLRWREGVL